MFFCLIWRPHTWIYHPQHPLPVLQCSMSVFFCLSLFLFIGKSVAFSWQFCYEVQCPEVTSSLLMLTLVFDEYYLVQLTVKYSRHCCLKLHTFRYEPPTAVSLLVACAVH